MCLPAIRGRPDLGAEVRRPDIGAPSWMLKGSDIPSITTTNPIDNVDGIASDDPRPLQIYYTEEGPIRLPYGDFGYKGFTPTVRALQRIHDVDSRLTGISDRYYR